MISLPSSTVSKSELRCRTASPRSFAWSSRARLNQARSSHQRAPCLRACDVDRAVETIRGFDDAPRTSAAARTLRRGDLTLGAMQLSFAPACRGLIEKGEAVIDHGAGRLDVAKSQQAGGRCCAEYGA